MLGYFVAVAEERNIGRAAARLHMTQPPLSRAIRGLEDELGVALLRRVHSGVELTAAGEVLLSEARSLLARSRAARDRVIGAAGDTALVVGTLADAAEVVGSRLISAFRERHLDVSVSIHEFDLGDPSAGLRSGRCDVALTRAPFDTTGLRTRVLARQRVGVVVRADDPLASVDSVRVDSLNNRRWIRLPQDADPTWQAYWTGPTTDAREAQELRTIQECLQSVLWNHMSALAPVDQVVPPELVIVPAVDRAPSELLLAWRAEDSGPLIRTLDTLAAGIANAAS